MKDILPSDEERIEEMFRDIELDESLEELDEEKIEEDDFTEAGYEPGDVGL